MIVIPKNTDVLLVPRIVKLSEVLTITNPKLKKAKTKRPLTFSSDEVLIDPAETYGDYRDIYAHYLMFCFELKDSENYQGMVVSLLDII